MCNDCIHKGVCGHRESCESLQASTKCYHIDEIFTLVIKCKFYESNVVKPSILNSYKMP